MINWFRKAQQDITKEVKPEQYKPEGAEGNLTINPAQDAFSAEDKVQQEKIKGLVEKYRNESQSIPSAETGKYAKSSLEKSADKLNFNPGMTKMPSVKQPGLSSGEDAGSKEFKDPGQTEKLEFPSGETKMPSAGMNVETVKPEGKYLTQGEKGDIGKAKTFSVPAGQDKVKIAVPMAKYESASGMQKQFSAYGINWFKRTADVVTPEVPGTENLAMTVKNLLERVEKIEQGTNPVTETVAQPLPVAAAAEVPALSDSEIASQELELVELEEVEEGKEELAVEAAKKGKKYSPKARKFIKRKIKKLVDEGKPQAQAEAQAINMAKQEGLKAPEAPKKEASAQVAELLLRYAKECPECFDKLVLAANAGLKKTSALTPEEEKELSGLMEATKTNPPTEAQKMRMTELQNRMK